VQCIACQKKHTKPPFQKKKKSKKKKTNQVKMTKSEPSS
jgi:hypothetical protein